MNTEQQEMFAKLADYSECKEQLLLRKVIAIVTIGMIAWAVSFAFLLMLMNSVTGAGLLRMFEVVVLLLFGTGSYYNHGISGVYYALLTLFGVFGMTGVAMNVISKKEQKNITKE